MSQQPDSPPPVKSDGARSVSTFRRIARFVVNHPVGVLQAFLYGLVAIVVLQNLESTSIDVLFWSIPTLPKLVLIFVSMFIGASLWELARSWLRR